MLKKTVSALSVALLAFAPLAANAQTSESESVIVNVADLDLSTPEGQARLEQRIKSAAKSVCGNPGSNTVQALRSYKTCVSEVIARHSNR